MADETRDIPVGEGMSETDPSYEQNEESIESKVKEGGEEGHAESSATTVAMVTKPDDTVADEMVSDIPNVKKEVKEDDVSGTVDGAAAAAAVEHVVVDDDADGGGGGGGGGGVDGVDDGGGGGGGVDGVDGGDGGAAGAEDQLGGEERERKEQEGTADQAGTEDNNEQLLENLKQTSQAEMAGQIDIEPTEVQSDLKLVKEGEETEERPAATTDEASTGIAETEVVEHLSEDEKKEIEKDIEEGEKVIEIYPTEDGEIFTTGDGIFGLEEGSMSVAFTAPSETGVIVAVKVLLKLLHVDGYRKNMRLEGIPEGQGEEKTPLDDDLVNMMDLGIYEPGLEIGETPLTYEDDLTQTKLEACDYEEKRNILMERYQTAINVLEEQQLRNTHVQQKLAEFFKKKKVDDTHIETKSTADQEERYLKLMAQIEDLQEQELTEKDRHYQYIEELKNKGTDKQGKVDSELATLYEFKREVAICAINSRTGEQIPKMDVEQYLLAEKKRQAEVSNIRLENIKLKNKLKKKEHQLKSTEELAEGLHLIDFEQLKIENQTYNEKIEERNEELQKLRKKIKSTVEVLTHLKEKLQFMKLENKMLGDELNKVELAVVQKRDRLNNTKQGRDYLRNDNQALQQSCGLLNNKTLLLNFEVQKDESEHLLQEVENLKLQYAEFSMNSKKLQKKIAAAEYQNHLF